MIEKNHHQRIQKVKYIVNNNSLISTQRLTSVSPALESFLNKALQVLKIANFPLVINSGLFVTKSDVTDSTICHVFSDSGIV